MKKILSLLLLGILFFGCLLKGEANHIWVINLKNDQNHSTIADNENHQLHHQNIATEGHFHFGHNNDDQKNHQQNTDHKPVDAHHQCHSHSQIDCCCYYEKIICDFKTLWKEAFIAFQENNDLYHSIFLESNFRPPIVV